MVDYTLNIGARPGASSVKSNLESDSDDTDFQEQRSDAEAGKSDDEDAGEMDAHDLEVVANTQASIAAPAAVKPAPIKPPGTNSRNPIII